MAAIYTYNPNLGRKVKEVNLVLFVLGCLSIGRLTKQTRNISYSKTIKL
jgi:hypothetical protein